MNRRTLAITAGAVVMVSGWALFRPELLFVNKTVNESFPGSLVQTAGGESTASPSTLLTGMFHDGAHATRGTATILQVGSKRLLRLTGFETSNGPDVRVLLIAAPDALDNTMVEAANPVELGSLKGNVGDQNYDVTSDIDLTKYRAVTIWCNRFGVNFGTAPLTPPQPGEPAAAQPMQLRTGQFHSVAHETRGTASIFQLGDGARVLRLTGFETSNGPDVRVLLVAAADATDSEIVKASNPVELGSLKGNVGDQNYDVPVSVDLDKYQAVTIWCNRFGVNFGTAPLR